jgi:hypothetical protein
LSGKEGTQDEALDRVAFRDLGGYRYLVLEFDCHRLFLQDGQGFGQQVVVRCEVVQKVLDLELGSICVLPLAHQGRVVLKVFGEHLQFKKSLRQQKQFVHAPIGARLAEVSYL